MHQYEQERQRLNELGQKSLEQGIPLSRNEDVQTQSRKVDELTNLMYQVKGIRARVFSLDFCTGGDRLNFPAWFLQAIQGRLEEVSAQVEYHADFGQVSEEESKAFQALFASMDAARLPEFTDWEDKLQSKHAVLYERLYLQGLKDGMQLGNAFSCSSVLVEDAAAREVSYTSTKGSE